MGQEYDVPVKGPDGNMIGTAKLDSDEFGNIVAEVCLSQIGVEDVFGKDNIIDTSNMNVYAESYSELFLDSKPLPNVTSKKSVKVLNETDVSDL